MVANSKRARAEQMDPNRFKMSVAPQPIPGAPQTNNVMNNPMVGQSFNEQTGSMSGVNKFPYGDGGIPLSDGRMGAVGFVGNSGMVQGLGGVQGRGQNMAAAYGAPQLAAPDNNTSEQMLAMNMAQTAAGFGGKLNPVDGNPSFKVQPGLGMSGMSPQEAVQQGVPGSISPMMKGQFQGQGPQGALPLSGSSDAQGMSTSRGGGRNKPSKA